MFLHRHPRTLVTSEQLAAFVGYDIQRIAISLETLIEADLLERTQNPMHAARMYVLVLDGPQNGGILKLLKLASTRNGRQSILQALDTGGSQPETEAPQPKPHLLKIA
jgi:DNA-binding MarR family transcriptional regulator